MADGKNREATVVLTVILGSAFAALNFYMPQVAEGSRGSESVWLVAVLFAMLMAQAMLIAVWSVFAPVNVVVRLPWAILLGVGVWFLFIAGIARAEHQSLAAVKSGISLAFGMLIILGIIGIQIPLWIAKLGFRFCIVPPGIDAANHGENRFQFQLKDLLIATFILAIAFSPLRYFLPGERLNHFGPGLVKVMIATAIAIGVNLVGTLPAIWAGFSELPIVLAALVLGVYSFVATIVEFAVVCGISGSPAGAKVGEIIGVTLTFNLSQSLVVLGVLRIYYALGYRIRRVPRVRLPILGSETRDQALDLKLAPGAKECSVDSEADPESTSPAN